MTVPTLPLHLVENLERRLVASVTAATSGFTGSQQVQDWGGEWWEFTFEMALTRGRDARRLSAFFAALGGMRGPFLFRDPSAGRSDLLADPIVSGGGQTGNTLVTSGWAASSPALETGDFISLGSGADTLVVSGHRRCRSEWIGQGEPADHAATALLAPEWCPPGNRRTDGSVAPDGPGAHTDQQGRQSSLQRDRAGSALMSRDVTAGFATALSEQSLRPILLFEGEFASGWVRVWSGLGELVWDGKIWTGMGSLISIGALEETSDVVASGTMISLSGVPLEMVGIAIEGSAAGQAGTGLVGTT